jgi:hypothetical protein
MNLNWSCQYSGKRLKKYGPIPYFPELMKMKTIDKILTMIIHWMKNQDDDQETMQDLQQNLRRTGVQVPTEIEGCKLLRKNNRKELVTLIKEEVRTGTM